MHLVDGTRQHKLAEPVIYAEKRNRKHIWKQEQPQTMQEQEIVQKPNK